MGLILLNVDIKQTDNAKHITKIATIARYYGWKKGTVTADAFLAELFHNDCKSLLVRRVEAALAASEKIESMRLAQERINKSDVAKDLFGDTKK